MVTNAFRLWVNPQLHSKLTMIETNETGSPMPFGCG